MKIAHVTSSFHLAAAGGIGNVCYYHALGAAQQGHEVHVFTRTQHDLIDPPGVKVHCFSKSFTARNRNGTVYPSALQNFDIVHLHAPNFFDEELFILLSRLNRSRYVVTYHQDPMLAGVGNFFARMRNVLISRPILAGAKQWLVSSLEYARTSQLAPLIRNHPERVIEIPTGVDIKRFRPDIDTGNLRYLSGFGVQDRLILLVSPLDKPPRQSGVDTLFRSLTLVPDPSVKLFILGDGRFRRRYESLARQLGLGERVIFRGWVSASLLPKHYIMSDFVVLPSIKMDAAFNTTLLEAMACARPVIASHLPGVASIIGEGQGDLLVRPGDITGLAEKVQHLLDNRANLRSIGERNRNTVTENYTCPRVVSRLLHTYENVLARS